jgi:O-antigen/teichoic acid export membrane protein
MDLRSLIRMEAGRQTAVLYGAQLLSMALNFVFTVVIGRALSQEDYGVFTFCVFSVVVFLGFLFEFGVFSAGARLLAIAESTDEERRTLGTLVVAGAAIGLAFGAVIAAIAPLVEPLLRLASELFLHGAGEPEAAITAPLLAAAPLAVAIPLQQLAELACQGANRIGALAVLRLALPVSSISIIAALTYAFGLISPATAVVAYRGGVFVSSALVLALLRPSFDIGRADFARVWSAVREFGLNIYAGRAISMMSLRLDQLLVPVFVGARRWGAYKIAQQVSEPISNLARAMATTRFKAFANAERVEAAIVRWNAVLLSVAAAGLAVVGPLLFAFVFPNKFRNARPLFLPFALVAFFAGLLQPYNMFLTAHGAGRSLRNISLAIGAANLVGLFAFTRRYGLGGAAWFAVASMAFNFALHLYYYRELLKTLETRSE